MALKSAEQLAEENKIFWQEVEAESANDHGGLSPFDVVMSRRYAESNLPYIAHQDGKTINVVTGQEVLRQAGPKVLQRSIRR